MCMGQIGFLLLGNACTDTECKGKAYYAPKLSNSRPISVDKL